MQEPIRTPEFTIWIHGHDRSDVFAAGDLLARLAAYRRWHVLGERLDMQSGTCQAPYDVKTAVKQESAYRIGVSAKRAPVQGAAPDIVFYLDTDPRPEGKGVVKRDGVCVRDGEPAAPAAVKEESAGEKSRGPEPAWVNVPISRLAAECGGTGSNRAGIVAGLVAGILDVLPAELESFAMSEPDELAEARAVKAAALARGLAHAKSAFGGHRGRLPESDAGAGSQILTCESILARALVQAGVHAAVSSSEPAPRRILTEFERELARVGVKGMTEAADGGDDAAAMALGASFGSDCAVVFLTSRSLAGAGETLAASSIAEIPLLAVVVQSAGADGLDAGASEQGELLSAIHGGPSQVPKIVVAAADLQGLGGICQDCVQLAERHQMPVVLLLDESLLRSVASLTVEERASRVRAKRRTPVEGIDARFRYESTPGGTSPRPVPGDVGFEYWATARHHDMAGRPVAPGNLREAGIQKRWRKFELARQGLEGAQWIQGLTASQALEEYDAVVLGFGSTAGALVEGARLAAQEGIRVLALHPIALHPLPHRHLTRIQSRFDSNRVLVFDQNPGGDLARHLQAELGLRARTFRKLDGHPLRPHDVLTRLREAFQRSG